MGTHTERAARAAEHLSSYRTAGGQVRYKTTPDPDPGGICGRGKSPHLLPRKALQRPARAGNATRFLIKVARKNQARGQDGEGVITIYRSVRVVAKTRRRRRLSPRRAGSFPDQDPHPYPSPSRSSSPIPKWWPISCRMVVRTSSINCRSLSLTSSTSSWKM